MHNIADRKTVMGRFKWELEAPSGTNASKSINVVDASQKLGMVYCMSLN